MSTAESKPPSAAIRGFHTLAMDQLETKPKVEGAPKRRLSKDAIEAVRAALATGTGIAISKSPVPSSNVAAPPQIAAPADADDEMPELVAMRQDLTAQIEDLRRRSPQSLATGAKRSVLERAVAMLDDEIVALAQLDRLSR